MFNKPAFLLLLVVALIITYNLIGQIFQTLKSGERLKTATDTLITLENRNKQLKEQLKEAKSKEYIEREARDKLGLVREGETMVVIPDEKLNSVLGISKTESQPRLPNWQGWLNLFFL
jgi:cell division protein DivIC